MKGINIEEGSKNFAAYYISKTDGCAEYRDCVIMYNGDPKDEYQENACKPEDIPAKELLEEVEDIVEKIKEVFA